MPSDLLLPQNFDEDFLKSINKLQLALDYLRESDQNIRQYGIRQVRNYSMLVNKSSNCDNDIIPQNYEDLMHIFTNSSDLKEIYEISYILLNISFYSKQIYVYLYNTNCIKNIFDKLIEIEEYTIKNQLLLILGNCLSENEEVYNKIIQTTYITGYVEDIFKNSQQKNIPRFYRNNLIWIVGNLYKYHNEHVINSLSVVIPELCKALNQTVDNDLFSEALVTMQRISKIESQNTIDILKEQNIHCTLTSYIGYNYNSDDMDIIFQILGNLSFYDDFFIQGMIENEFLSMTEIFLLTFYEKLINQVQNDFIKKYKSAFSSLCWLLSNVACYDKPSIKSKIARKTKIPSLLLKIVELFSDKNCLLNILSFYESLLEVNNTNVKTELLRIGVFEYLCSQINNHSDEIKLKCINSLGVFLEYGSGIMKDRNIIKESMKSQGVDIAMEVLITSQNTLVSQGALSLLHTYFNDH